MEVITAFTDKSTVETAIIDLRNQVRGSKWEVIVFFASTNYNFYELSSEMSKLFPQAKVVGTTTIGEVSNHGITDNSITMLALTGVDAEVVTIENTSTLPILSRKELIKAKNRIGFRDRGFVLTLTDGLSMSEERVLAILNATFSDTTIPIIGGSSASSDNSEILLSVNGEVYKNSSVALMVKTPYSVVVYKETAFTKKGIRGIVTKADIDKRIVYEIDNMPATEFYAKALNVPLNSLEKYTVTNPMLRVVGSDIRVASPLSLNADKSITFYCQVPLNTILDVGEPVDFKEKADETIRYIQSKKRKVTGALMVNCILRKLQMEQAGISRTLFKQYPFPVVGFCSYGEQLNRTHYNQTLTILCFGEE